MRTMDARVDFLFNKRWLHEFGNATLHNTGDNEEQTILSNSKHNVKEISLVDGSIYTGRKFEPLPIPLNIFFRERFDIDEFIEWISVEEGGWLQYKNEERKIKVVLNGSVKTENYFRSNGYCGSMSIEFIAYEPHWYEAEPRYVEIENPIVGQEYGFYNDGNLPSKPIIELKCVGEKTNIAIKFNEYEIKIDNFTENIKIDTNYGTITSFINGKEVNKYNSYELIGGYHKRQMIETKCGQHNSFSIIRGDISEIKVTPNIRWRS